VRTFWPNTSFVFLIPPASPRPLCPALPQLGRLALLPNEAARLLGSVAPAFRPEIRLLRRARACALRAYANLAHICPVEGLPRYPSLSPARRPLVKARVV